MKPEPAPRDVSYEDALIESLRDPHEAAAYLEVTMADGRPAHIPSGAAERGKGPRGGCLTRPVT